MELKEKRTAVLEHSVQYICGLCEKKKHPDPFELLLVSHGVSGEVYVGVRISKRMTS